MPAVTFKGSKDDAGAVEIDGLTLEKNGDPVELTDEQVERLPEGHRFAVGDEAEKLTGDALDARVKELGIEGASGMSADEKRAAVAAAEEADG